MARLSREVVVSEKLDGTNGQICITEDGQVFAGSRTRWITPAADNYGFARWVEGNKADLLRLGPGRHFGEFWGNGIQRRYGQAKKHFSLFNTLRWGPGNTPGYGVTDLKDQLLGPTCCDVVPVLYRGPFNSADIERVLRDLAIFGSTAAPGFMDPEGIVIFHVAAGFCFKKTIKDDEQPKSLLPPEMKVDDGGFRQ